MKKSLFRIIPFLALGLLLITQFNNCSSGMDSQPTTTYTDQGSQGGSPCVASGCVEPNEAWLKLTANVSGGQYGVTAVQREFNLGGDCNEGGYPANEVRWELALNGSVVRNSTFSGLVTGGGPALSQCVNGRYMIYVNLASIPQDPVDRVGLRVATTGTTRAAYTLDIQIISKDQAGGTHTNTIEAKRRITLMPL